MKTYLSLFATLFLLTNTISAQEMKKITMTPVEIEAVFIQQNLQLIAEKLNVSMADAAIAQAKLWDNPTLSIGDINFWKSGQDKEFSVELSQLVQTANKRGKLVGRERISKEMNIQQFEDVLRGLKAELRKTINEYVYQKEYSQVLHSQQQSLTQLIESYQKQVAKGDVSKSELLRLQSALFELESELNDVQMELNKQQKDLKALLNAEPVVTIDVIPENKKIYLPDQLPLSQLIEMGSSSRPDLKRNQLQIQYFEKSLAYEKSLRVPDITFSAAYDRYGGTWNNFVGIGVSFDIPFLNRNQGNIKAAQISHDQSKYFADQQQNLAQYEIVEAFNNYTSVYNFYKRMTENPLLGELDNMLEVYSKNLLNKNISMVEFIDFLDAYKSNKQTFLSMRKNVAVQFEELQYAVGTDINKP